MAAAGLGRCILSGIRVTGRFSHRVASRGGPWLPTRCSVALTAREYSSTAGLFIAVAVNSGTFDPIWVQDPTASLPNLTSG